MARRDGVITLEEGWTAMMEGLTKLEKVLEHKEEGKGFTSKEYMDHYTNIYNMCVQKVPYDYSEQLYYNYREFLEGYMDRVVLPALQGATGVKLLRGLAERWENHKLMVRWMKRVFNYLDRYYVQRHNLHCMNDVGLMVWKETPTNHTPHNVTNQAERVHDRVRVAATAALLEQVDRDREGEVVDAPLLAAVLSSYQEVGMGLLDAYVDDFERSLVAQAGLYYRAKALTWLSSMSTPEYLHRAEASWEAENRRVEAFLHVSTKPKLLHVTETELIKQHSKALLEKEESGCAALLRDNKKEDLARMYRLFSRIPKGLDPMANLFKAHIEEQGLAEVAAATEAVEAKQARDKEAGRPSKDGNAAPEQEFIKKIIALHDIYLAFVTEDFGNSSIFHKALKEAFEAFCNKKIGKIEVAEAMASFCDALLRKGLSSERLTEDEVEVLLEKVVKLLAFVSNTDVFAEFYRNKLSRRLLGSHSASEDLEKGVLTRLKRERGAQFTSKMEGMVQDLALAKQKDEDFQAWRQDRGLTTGIDVSVTVLTTGFWPTFKSLDVSLPEEMLLSLDQFAQFHDAQTHSSRRLTWQLTLGTVHVRATFDKQYELIVAPAQAAILALFNEADSLTWSEIQEAVKIPADDLDRVLASLSLAKHKLLTKLPASRVVGREDSFAYNTSFTDRARRIRVAVPPMEDRRKVAEDVSKDRKNAVEAAVVRVMKARKTLSHQQLVMEVVAQLRKSFTPDMKLLKSCIESLIGREFLERDPSSTSQYNYVA